MSIELTFITCYPVALYTKQYHERCYVYVMGGGVHGAFTAVTMIYRQPPTNSYTQLSASLLAVMYKFLIKQKLWA